MAVVYPTNVPTAPEPPASPGRQALDFAQQHVLLAAVLVLGIALLIGFLIHKISGSSSTTSTTTPTITGTDATGQQTLYVPTQNTYENIYTATDSNNNAPVNSPMTDTTNNTTTPGPAGPPGAAGPPGPPGTATTPPPVASTHYAHVRAGTGTGAPIRSTSDPKGKVIDYAPFGKTVVLVNPTPVNGFYEAWTIHHMIGFLSTKDVTGLS